MKTKTKDYKKKVLLLITGSIAAVKIPLLVSQLAKENYEIRCVLSKNAEKLIKPLSLSILSRNHCILEEDNYKTPCEGLKDWHLLRALAINRPELTSDYIHLLDQEPFDEN